MPISYSVCSNYLKRVDHHIGGLVRFKTKIWWLRERRVDDIDNRVCLLTGWSKNKDGHYPAKGVLETKKQITFLISVLLDGENIGIWVNEEEMELIDELC